MFKKIRMSAESIGEKRNMGELYRAFLLKRRMNKIDKWKPGILASMREEAENKCALEYNATIEKITDENYELNHIVNTLRSDSNKWKGKYEEIKELYDRVLEKLEGKTQSLGEAKKELEVTNQSLGETKKELEVTTQSLGETKKELEEVKEELVNTTVEEVQVPLEENPSFQKEMKQLVTRCNNPEKYRKSEIMSAFSAKWNVSLKEIVEEDKLVDFKYKKIED